MIRFWSKVDTNGPILMPELGPCWMWLAGVDGDGYGRFNLGGINRKATHVAWLLTKGTWTFKSLLHKCDNVLCVRKAHLYEGTQQDNVKDREVRHRRKVEHDRDSLGRFTTTRRASCTISVQ